MGFLINISARALLIGVMLCGAAYVHMSLPKDRIVKLFRNLLLLFALSFALGAINVILDRGVVHTITPILDAEMLLIAGSLQFYMQYFIFNTIFSRRDAMKWMTIQIVPIAILILICELMGWFSFGETIDRDTPFRELLANPAYVSRGSLVLLQLLYGSFSLVIATKLLPIYQQYIYSTESNTSRNMIWVRELFVLFFALSSTYTLYAFTNRPSSSILYLIAALYFFSRTINLMFTNYTPNFNADGELYDSSGIKWSFRRLWYTPTPEHKGAKKDRQTFECIDRWIDDNRAYSDPDFSYNTLVKEFPKVDYKQLNNMLQRYCECNFQSYIRLKRIERAMELIRDAKGKVQFKILATEVGFDNNSSFARAFKAVTGVSATEWRDQNA